MTMMWASLCVGAFVIGPADRSALHKNTHQWWNKKSNEKKQKNTHIHSSTVFRLQQTTRQQRRKNKNNNNDVLLDQLGSNDEALPVFSSMISEKEEMDEKEDGDQEQQHLNRMYRMLAVEDPTWFDEFVVSTLTFAPPATTTTAKSDDTELGERMGSDPDTVCRIGFPALNKNRYLMELIQQFKQGDLDSSAGRATITAATILQNDDIHHQDSLETETAEENSGRTIERYISGGDEDEDSEINTDDTSLSSDDASVDSGEARRSFSTEKLSLSSISSAVIRTKGDDKADTTEAFDQAQLTTASATSEPFATTTMTTTSDGNESLETKIDQSSVGDRYEGSDDLSNTNGVVDTETTDALERQEQGKWSIGMVEVATTAPNALNAGVRNETEGCTTETARPLENPGQSSLNQAISPLHHARQTRTALSSPSTRTTTLEDGVPEEENERQRFVAFRIAHSTKYKQVSLSQVQNLGYSEDDILALDPEALASILSNQVRRPGSGLPPRWKRSNGIDSSLVQIVDQSQAPTGLRLQGGQGKDEDTTTKQGPYTGSLETNTATSLNSQSSENATLITNDTESNRSYTVYYKTEGPSQLSMLQKVTLDKLQALGYDETDVTNLQPSVLDIVVKEKISKPKGGLPSRWTTTKTNDGDLTLESTVQIMDSSQIDNLPRKVQTKREQPDVTSSNVKRENRETSAVGSPPENDPRREKPRMERLDNRRSLKDESTQKARRPRSSYRENGEVKPIYNGRQSSLSRQQQQQHKQQQLQTRRRRLDDDPPKPKGWPDMDTFRNLLRQEAKIRLFVVGDGLSDLVKQECDWRLQLYNDWLWVIHDGVGNPIVESRSDRARRMAEQGIRRRSSSSNNSNANSNMKDRTRTKSRTVTSTTTRRRENRR